jgi:2-iminobutanoate/2-iminopropanoate deaminase
MKAVGIVLACAAVICSSVAAAAGASRPGIENLPAVMLHGKALPFSEGVRVGDVLYLSGQIGLGTDDTLPQGIEAQTQNTMDRIGKTLKSVGLSWKDVFSCTVLLANMADWPTFNRIYAPFLNPDHLPARSAFGVNGLALDALVEVQCEAYDPQK